MVGISANPGRPCGLTAHDIENPGFHPSYLETPWGHVSLFFVTLRESVANKWNTPMQSYLPTHVHESDFPTPTIRWHVLVFNWKPKIRAVPSLFTKPSVRSEVCVSPHLVGLYILAKIQAPMTDLKNGRKFFSTEKRLNNHVRLLSVIEGVHTDENIVDPQLLQALTL